MLDSCCVGFFPENRLADLHTGGGAEEVVGHTGVGADLATGPQQDQMVVSLSEEEDAWLGVVGGGFHRMLQLQLHHHHHSTQDLCLL